MRMLLLASAILLIAGPTFACGYDQTASSQKSDQVATGNEVFAPAQPDYDRAEAILAAYAHATSTAGGSRGAVMLGDEMIDEASRKMAEVIAAKGRAAGLRVSAT